MLIISTRASELNGHSPLDIDLYSGLSVLVDDLEWEVLDVGLDFLLVPLATNQSLDVEDCPTRIAGVLVLCCVSDQSLFVCPCDP